jgi:hypothetical protein
MQVSIRNVEEQTFRDFKAESVREGMQVGKALTLAMKYWLENVEHKPKVRFLDFGPKHWGKETKKTSNEIDSLVY